jgi:hypothetical protein
MKDISFGYRIQQDEELLSLAKQRNKELGEVLGRPAAAQVSAEWDCSEDAEVRPVVTLRLWDSLASTTTVFRPKELESGEHMAVRFNRLWRDLLQVRSEKQLQELHEAMASEGS